MFQYYTYCRTAANPKSSKEADAHAEAEDNAHDEAEADADGEAEADADAEAEAEAWSGCNTVQYILYIMAGLCSTRIYLAQEPDLYRFILFLGYSFSIICSNNAIISKFTGHKPTSMPHLMHNLPLWWVSIFPL